MSTPYEEALAGTLIDRTIREKIVLVAVALPGDDEEMVEASLDELALLVDTAGADEVARVIQKRDAPDHTWYIGKGKVDELKELCLALDVDTVVFDNELAPSQQYNLEKLLGRTALDRTAVILDIFGQNAHTMEGKAQVELALLRYRLPRLRRGKNAKMSQQRGGVGARFGGGETKMEVDRRRIMRRINKLEKDLSALAETRALQRQGRRRSGLASVAIVGYTNAGKSTLLNQLTQSGVLTEDRLFATLDPTTRRLALPGGEPVLLTDTVGFISRLPHGLVESFKGTLEVAALADYLVHVVDVTAPDPEGQIAAVHEVLREIEASAVPELLVFNKADADPIAAKELVESHPGSVALSARTGEGADVFLRTIGDRLRSLSVVYELVVPYDRGDVLASIHREGEVVSVGDGETEWTIRARLSDASAGRLDEFVVGDDAPADDRASADTDRSDAEPSEETL
ncbi:GTPase HflX [Ilumatobacter coccineus]|uniref:GTPase HflX n=1 Tax=Ilumatobacter coccineus (strain NBRC 103263 / KCTC 29153 / YM16-304) TaxID=1313172 RepID=A0A6C7E5F9_ILUCY|nr:GTPase HflX [Ilumatobacter coccineus]BAN03014.1 GTP-binding protein [Ilumatobacter coccineus YM16-304]